MKIRKSLHLFLIVLCVICMGTTFASAADTSAVDDEKDYIEGFWVEEDNLYYYEDNIKFIPDEPGLYLIEDYYYYFTETGAVFMAPDGICEIDGKSYYFYDEYCIYSVPEPGLYDVDGTVYYFFADNSILTVDAAGFYEIDGMYFYVREDNSVYAPGEGVFKIGKKYYYIYEDGEIFTEGWMDFDGKEGYFTKNGGMTGTVVLDNLVYHFNQKAELILSKTADYNIVRKANGTIMEIRTVAKQSVFGYDTLQGSCTDGTYGYYVLYNRDVEKCKIAKIRLSDGKLIKVSKVLNIGHGNGITYNSKKDYLVVVHMTTDGKRLSVINAKTLKSVKNVNVKIPAKLEGATKSNLENITRFGGISYNAKRDVYMVLLSKSHNLLLLDSNFKPLSYIKLSSKPSYVYQCINVTDDYVLIGMSPSKSSQIYNIICVYEWDGTYRFMINAKKGYELESVYNIGDDLYAGFYCSYWQSYYKTVKETVTINGKKVVKKIKQQDYRLVRSNYVYQLSNYMWEI